VKSAMWLGLYTGTGREEMWVSRTACEEWVWLHGSFQDAPRFRVQGIDFSAAQIDLAISSARNSTRILTIKQRRNFLRSELLDTHLGWKWIGSGF